MNVLVWCVLLTVGGVCGQAGSKEAAVRDLFREVLHIKPPRAPGPRPLQAPRHMLELYQRYTDRQPSDSVTTTIRNILPSPSTDLLGKDLLLFNVSGVQPEEEVRLAQLQLNRRRLHQRHPLSRRLLAPPYRVRLYRATPSRLAPLASVPVSMVQRSAWGAVDVTAALRELLLDPRTLTHQLAVRFESPGGKPIPPSHFLRGVPHTPYAFLVVFTEDNAEIVSEDGEESLSRPPVHTHALVQTLQRGQHWDLFREEEDNSPPLIPLLGIVKEKRLFTMNNTMSTTKQSSSPTPKPVNFDDIADTNNRYTTGELLLRKTRSIIDNQLPDDDDLMEAPVPLTARTDLLRHPDSPGRKPRKGKKGKRKRGKKQKYPPSLDALQNVYHNPEEVAGRCTVRKMTVNFTEIGWGEWIISPDKFDANYCVGSCRFPLTKAVKPSNHATLQSLVHALGHNPQVPAPSCVPHHMTLEVAVKPSNHATLQSLVHALGHNPQVPAPACVPHHMTAVTLLYYDETLNVVIKNYPSMVVDSCACR